MRAFPKLTEEQLKDALGERFNPDCIYKLVLTREQKQARRKGWQNTGSTVDLGNTGEHALYLVPQAPAAGRPMDPNTTGVAGPSVGSNTTAAGTTAAGSSQVPEPKKAKAPKAKVALKKFLTQKETRDGGSSGSTGEK